MIVWWSTARPIERVGALGAVVAVVAAGVVAVVATRPHGSAAATADVPHRISGVPDGTPVPVVTAPAARSAHRVQHASAHHRHRHVARRHTRSAPTTSRSAHRHVQHGSAVHEHRGAGRPGAAAPAPASSAGHAPIVVGVDVQDPDAVEQFFKQYSVDAAPGDPRAQADAMTRWLDAHGGVDGRQVTVRLREFSMYGRATSKDDEATCADWKTGDRPVADVDQHSSVDILTPCLVKAGIPSIQSDTTPPAQNTFAAFPDGVFVPGGPALDRVQAAYVGALAAAGFFKGGHVGLLTATGLPQLDTAKAALGAAVRAAGVNPVAESDISMEDPASFFASEADAVLRFKLKNVQRIVVLDRDGLAIGQFMRGAQAQGYRPLYGVSSMSAPAFLAGRVPASQLTGAIGFGWSPFLDVRAADDPTSNPARRECTQALAGVNVGGRTPFGQFAAYSLCDSMLALRDALSHGGSVSAGMDRLSGRDAATTLGASLGPGSHAGATVGRLLRYSGDCGCFRYSGDDQPL